MEKETPQTATAAGGEARTDAQAAAERNGHRRIVVPVESKDGKASTTADAAKGRPRTIWREYFESLVVTAIMALFGMTFIVQAVKVPTGSMENTITIGDHLLVNKFIFAPGRILPFLPMREIRRGDIIVFKYPGNQYDPNSPMDREPNNIPFKTNYVKRVIGLPGDQVEIRGEDVYINGQLLPEHHIITYDQSELAPLAIRADTPHKAGETYNVYLSKNRIVDNGHLNQDGNQDGKVVVPPNKYFVMGDNRNNSADSRFWGFVPRDLIIGHALFVYWSYDESAPSTGNPILNFFRNTRWSRTGTMVK